MAPASNSQNDRANNTITLVPPKDIRQVGFRPLSKAAK
jgi:hypothetical protein